MLYVLNASFSTSAPNFAPSRGLPSLTTIAISIIMIAAVSSVHLQVTKKNRARERIHEKSLNLEWILAKTWRSLEKPAALSFSTTP